MKNIGLVVLVVFSSGCMVAKGTEKAPETDYKTCFYFDAEKKLA